jgi:uncharacterized protein
MMETAKKTLVLGASDNPARYSYLAMRRLQAHKHPVVAVGRKNTEVNGISVHKEPVIENDIDTVTLYLNPTHQQQYYNYILDLHPKRIIFNPGTENPELMRLARERGIEPYIGCTLVMLSTGQY